MTPENLEYTEQALRHKPQGLFTKIIQESSRQSSCWSYS